MGSNRVKYRGAQKEADGDEWPHEEAHDNLRPAPVSCQPPGERSETSKRERRPFQRPRPGEDSRMHRHRGINHGESLKETVGDKCPHEDA
jgi:hypothetical protein